jgi:hypothetical protein
MVKKADRRKGVDFLLRRASIKKLVLLKIGNRRGSMEKARRLLNPR